MIIIKIEAAGLLFSDGIVETHTDSVLHRCLQEVAEELERATERQIEQERGGGASANGSADADAKERKAKASKYDMLRPRASFESPEAFVLHFFKVCDPTRSASSRCSCCACSRPGCSRNLFIPIGKD